jgi:Ring finger domain
MEELDGNCIQKARATLRFPSDVPDDFIYRYFINFDKNQAIVKKLREKIIKKNLLQSSETNSAALSYLLPQLNPEIPAKLLNNSEDIKKEMGKLQKITPFNKVPAIFPDQSIKKIKNIKEKISEGIQMLDRNINIIVSKELSELLEFLRLNEETIDKNRELFDLYNIFIEKKTQYTYALESRDMEIANSLYMDQEFDEEDDLRQIDPIYKELYVNPEFHPKDNRLDLIKPIRSDFCINQEFYEKNNHLGQASSIKIELKQNNSKIPEEIKLYQTIEDQKKEYIKSKNIDYSKRNPIKKPSPFYPLPIPKLTSNQIPNEPYIRSHQSLRPDLDYPMFEDEYMPTYEELLELDTQNYDLGNGLNPYQLSFLEIIEFNRDMESKECPICHECYIPGEQLTFIPCGHQFHYACICEWLQRKKRCPMNCDIDFN